MAHYFYKIGILKCLISNYRELDDGVSFREGLNPITDPFSLAEFRADIDTGLSLLGKRFRGVKGKSWKYFRGYPIYEKVIIADILNLSNRDLRIANDSELVDNRNQLKKEAYKKLAGILNGVKE